MKNSKMAVKEKKLLVMTRKDEGKKRTNRRRKQTTEDKIENINIPKDNALNVTTCQNI